MLLCVYLYCPSVLSLGLLGGIFHFYSNFNKTFCKQTVDYIQLPLSVDLWSALFAFVPKMGARLIWVNHVILHNDKGNEIYPTVVKWLSGRVLDSRQKGGGFEPHWGHCLVSLSKTH